MHSVVTLVAQDGLYVVGLLALVVWLLMPRAGKVAMGVEGVVGVIAVAILVKVAGAVHTDPRPFVQDPSIHPWFAHSADNGFPSDHTAVAAMTSFVVLRHRLEAGLLLLAISAVVGASRVVAHVHHVQDVVAGGVIGLVAAAIGFAAWRVISGTQVATRATGSSRPAQQTSPTS